MNFATFPTPITKCRQGEFVASVISAGVVCLLITAAGCNRGPAPIEPVHIDASSASELAIETYDKDGDQQLSEEELLTVPGMLKHREKYDIDQDGLISADEIEQRIELWEEQAMGIRPLSVVVQLDGQPLADAEVQFIPETYLGDGPKRAQGKTNAAGTARRQAPDENPRYRSPSLQVP